MILHVLAVGRVADSSLRASCDEYARRVQRVWPLSIHEVRSPSGSYPAAERRRREGERLLARLPRRSLMVGLTRSGEDQSSVAFARRLAGWQNEGRDVTFVIGGADGLDSRVLARCELRMTLSPFTLPHELARLVLLEQLYRGATILRGSPYHKGR